VEQELYDVQDDVLTFDIDTTIDTLQAQVHQHKIPPKSPRVSPAVAFWMSKEKWIKLLPEAHEIWDQQDDHSKSTIY